MYHIESIYRKNFVDSKITEIINNDGFLIELIVTNESYDMTFMSTNKKHFYTKDNSPYRACDQIIVKASNPSYLDIFFNENPNWVKLGENKWGFNNDKNNFKTIAEIVTNGSEKSILIKGTFYGKRGQSQSRWRAKKS